MNGELHVLFKVAESEYVVNATDVLHMESFNGATKVPGTQSHVVGLMQIRQRVVPIIDLRVRFGLLGSEPTIDSRVVVVQCDERAIGLLVDSAREVVHLAADAFSAPPDVVTERAQGFVRSVARAGARLVMLIDLPKVIGEEALSGEQRVD
ncbi:MAG TPA: chemotaxis protein CheW [Polyangiales bacterium]|nr:chemotaxis protein CheW [Polyangiales bacterium]